MVRAIKLLAEVKSHYGDLKNYIGGTWRTPETTEWLEDTNPATGGGIARGPLSTNEDVGVAGQEALRAWGTWRGAPPPGRGGDFFALRDLVGKRFGGLLRGIVPNKG